MEGSLRHRIGYVVRRLLPRTALLRGACERYVDWCNGDENYDLDINGEGRLMRLLIPGARTVFDVGANRGDWAHFALKLNPAIDLHCFEPSHAAFALLENSMPKPVPPNVRLNHTGLGDAPGEHEFFVFSPADSVNSLYARADSASGTGARPVLERIVIDTLDRYCAGAGIEQIDFLKIDVEGHERSVLAGAKEMLSKHRIRAVQFEYAPSYLYARIQLRDVLEQFAEAGYIVYKLFPAELREVSRYDVGLERFRYSNWAAAPREHPLPSRPWR
jgi:FkbM family methyltransferase